MMKIANRNIIRKMASLSGVAIFLLSSLACSRIEKVEYSRFYDFGRRGWDPVECLEFNPWPADSVMHPGDKFDIILCVRYSGKCRLRELPLRIEQVSLSQAPDTLSLSIPLFTSSGARRGKGPYTVYEITDTIVRSVSLSEGYTLTLFNPLDARATAGITNIGLILSNPQ